MCLDRTAWCLTNRSSRSSQSGFTRPLGRLNGDVEAVEKVQTEWFRSVNAKIDLSECARFDASTRGRGKRNSRKQVDSRFKGFFYSLVRVLMSPVVLKLIRTVLVPVFAAAIMLVYGYVLGFLGDAIPRGESPFYLYAKIFAEGFLSASVVALIFDYPLAFVYRHHSFVAALFMTLPVLYFRLPGLIDSSRRPIALFLAAYEVGAFVVLLVLGTAFAYRHLLRSNLAFDPDAQKPMGAGQRQRCHKQ